MTRRLHVTAVGAALPGLESWEHLGAHLAEPDPDFAIPEGWSPMPEGLPRRQALRLSESTRVALVAAQQVSHALPADAGWVFASSSGEGWILDQVLSALCEPEIMVQPLRFQNAVHNAAQGQWSILAGATEAMTSIAAYDETAGAGLLKAMMQAVLEGTPVGLVIFDAPLPPPLHEKRPFAFPMALALALGTEPSEASLATLEITLGAGPAPAAPVSRCEVLNASGNPVRFALPLLDAIARPGGQRVALGLPGSGCLEVTVHGGPDAR